MGVQEIPRQEWIRFCNDYSRQHEGWIATIEVRGTDVGDRVEARGLPLRGVTYEEKGTDQGSIEIYLDQGVDRNEAHVVNHPTRVFVNRDAGMDQDLEVDADDGTKTFVRFENKGQSNRDARI